MNIKRNPMLNLRTFVRMYTYEKKKKKKRTLIRNANKKPLSRNILLYNINLYICYR